MAGPGKVVLGSETGNFPLGDILSVTNGILLSPRGVEGLYDILEWMTGDEVSTHQIPRVIGECREPLLDQHPDLAADALPPEFKGNREGTLAWSRPPSPGSGTAARSLRWHARTTRVSTPSPRRGRRHRIRA